MNITWNITWNIPISLPYIQRAHGVSIDTYCTACPASQYYDPTKNTCTTCPPDRVPYREISVGHGTDVGWSHWPDMIAETHARAQGWKLSKDSLVLSSVSREVAQSSLDMTMAFATKGALHFVVEIQDSVNHHHDVDTRLEIEIDGELVTLDSGRTRMTRGRYQESLDVLTPGLHSFRFNFFHIRGPIELRQLTFSGTVTGPALSCERCWDGSEVTSDHNACAPCRAGRATNGVSPRCEACPENSISAAGAHVCRPCGDNMFRYVQVLVSFLLKGHIHMFIYSSEYMFI